MPNIRQKIRIRQSVFGRIFRFGKVYSAEYSDSAKITIRHTPKENNMVLNQKIVQKVRNFTNFKYNSRLS